MLSIIISSYQTHYFSALEKNIAETCGMPYEILKIENPGKMGICKAYNIGAEKAKYENLLFVHEDVLFETQNWGEILVDYLQTENIGCIGVAGATYVPNVPCGWWMVSGYAYSHLAHINKKTNERYDYTFSGSENGLLKVRFIDGVFIACKKATWAEYKFDERLTNFHSYDISFSLHLDSKFQNFITNRINISHFSAGSLTKVWLEQLLLNRKLNKIFYKENRINNDTEIRIYRLFAHHLKEYEFTKREILFHLVKFLNLKRLGVKGFLKALRIIYWSI